MADNIEDVNDGMPIYPNQTIKIKGTQFGATEGITALRYATGTFYLDVQTWTDTEITAITPPDTPPGTTSTAFVTPFGNPQPQWVGISVPTIADLRNKEPEFDGQSINLNGHTVFGVGGGVFVHDASDSTSADDNGVVIVTVGGARWKRVLDGFVTPEMFGLLDGVNNNLIVQDADIVAGTLQVDLKFISIVDLSTSVVKQSSANWVGDGGLGRLSTYSGNAFPLVYISDLNGWSIDNCSFYNARHETVTISSSAMTDGNTCIAVERCDNWNVRDCQLVRYSLGLAYSDCNGFSITGNTCRGDTGKDISGYEDGTFMPFSVYTGTGDISSDQQLGVVTPPSTNYTISNNNCFSVGLDISIGICIQAYERTPCIVNANVIIGQYAGIQVYKGTLTDTGTETYQRNVIITNNLISFMYQQGIYIRLCFGCLVQGNLIRKSNMNGVVSESGTPFGGIITRISLKTQGGAVISPVGDDVGNLIIGNMILDTGRNITGCMKAVQIRTESTSVINNVVAQSEELYGLSPKVGSGIYVADNVINFDISGNSIHNFTKGIEATRTIWDSDKRSKIVNNKISKVLEEAILCECRMSVLIYGNQLTEFETGIYVRYSPYSKVVGNTLINGDNGVLLRRGNYHSDIDDRSANKIGQTLIVKDNVYENVTTSHAIAETGGTDAFFFSRCAIFRGDIVDGISTEYQRSGGLPVATSNQKSWNIGDTIKNATPASRADIVGVCIAPGTYGTLTAVTGGISSGSDILTVNDSDGLAPNVYITIVGVSGIKRILDVNNLVVTLDSTASATVTGAVVAYAVPVFA